MYTVMEQTRLNYLRFNQKQIRAELYNGLQDAMYSGDSTTNVGQRIILPSHKSNEKKSDFADFNITMPILI